MRFKGLDLNLLMAFDTLLHTRSVSRAADRMHLSQAAMSSALGRLRDYFGDQILLVQGKRAPEAIPWFERALAGSPSFAEARLNLGIAYQESGDRRKAADVYRQLIATSGPGGGRERQAASELLRQLRK